MRLTVTQILEALTNTAGRWRTLERLVPEFTGAISREACQHTVAPSGGLKTATADVGLATGSPIFYLPGRGLVDFPVTLDGVKYVLRCPLEAGPTVRKRLGRFSGWRLLADEAVLFDRDGNAFTIDVLLRPQAPEIHPQTPPPEVLASMGHLEELVWDPAWGVAAAMFEGDWMLLDAGGRRLTKRTYEWLGECSEGLILAERGRKCGFVDTAGREVVPCIYDDAGSFSGGVAQVKLGGDTYYIDVSGRRVEE